MKKLLYTFFFVIFFLVSHFFLVYYFDNDKNFVYPKLKIFNLFKKEKYYSYAELNFNEIKNADTIFFGTSRINVFPKRFYYKDNKVINLSYGGESINRTINKAKLINNEFDNIKKIYFFLDLWAFNAFYDLDKITSNRTKNIFNDKNIKKILKNLNNKKIKVEFPELYLDDKLKYPDIERNKNIYMTYLTDQYFPGFDPEFNFSFDNRNGLETIKEFKRLLYSLKSNNKEVVIVFNPIHVELLYIIKELGLMKKKFDFQKFIYQYNNAKLNFEVYNFLVLSQKNQHKLSKNKYFKDLAHFSEIYAKDILKIIFKDQNCFDDCIEVSETKLDKKNIEILQSLKKWELENPEIVKQIDFDLISTNESRGKVLSGDGAGGI